MTQQANKDASIKKSALHNVETAQHTGEKVLELGREGMENVAGMAESAHRAVGEYVKICSDHVCTGLGTGTKAVHALQQAGSELAQCHSRALHDNVELVKEAMCCRAMDDVLELQDKAFRLKSDNYFTTVNNFTNIMFDFWNQALKPIGERAASESQQLRRTLAA